MNFSFTFDSEIAEDPPQITASLREPVKLGSRDFEGVLQLESSRSVLLRGWAHEAQGVAADLLQVEFLRDEIELPAGIAHTLAFRARLTGPHPPGAGPRITLRAQVEEL